LVLLVAWVAAASAQCTTMLKASLSTFFNNMDDNLAVASDRVQLCEMCIRVNKYALLLAKKRSDDFESTVASHACSSYDVHREDDCVTLAHAVLRDFNRADATFTAAELNLPVEKLRELIVSRSDQRCAEMSCCGSKIFRRRQYPDTNGQLQPEDIEEEARVLARQEMDLVKTRAEILQQKLAMDDRIDRLRHDTQWIEKTKANVRKRRAELDDMEQRLKHREERLTEKEDDLAERQKLTPYYIPYPINMPNSAPTTPSPSPASSPPASSSQSTTAQATPMSPSSLEKTKKTTSSEGEDIDPIRDLDERDDQTFLELMQRIHDMVDEEDDSRDGTRHRHQ